MRHLTYCTIGVCADVEMFWVRLSNNEEHGTLAQEELAIGPIMSALHQHRILSPIHMQVPSKSYQYPHMYFPVSSLFRCTYHV